MAASKKPNTVSADTSPESVRGHLPLKKVSADKILLYNIQVFIIHCATVPDF